MSYHGRDVEIVFLDEEKCMVMSCDSAGAIGDKEFDIVKVSPYLVGRLTARVALLELISVGAIPHMLSATISNEPFPTAEHMLNGVKDELLFMKLENVINHLAVSTEKNFETLQTGLGITIIGTCSNRSLRIAASQSGDYVYVLGIPKVGNEIHGVDDVEIINGNHITSLLKNPSVHDIIPVGSQGILKEIELLCENTNCTFEQDLTAQINMVKSAGPSTCLFFTTAREMELQEFGNLPATNVGRLGGTVNK